MNDEQQKETQPRVLLVEDEASAAMVLSDVLRQSGYEVLVAGDGEEGLKIALEEHPDLILTDLMMPNMSGLDMVDKLRKDDWGKNVEVIILTNRSDGDALEEAMKRGAFFYMIKSESSMTDIVNKVESRLKLKRQQA
jgi:CheY-like chemotaxis protein